MKADSRRGTLLDIHNDCVFVVKFGGLGGVLGFAGFGWLEFVGFDPGIGKPALMHGVGDVGAPGAGFEEEPGKLP